MCVETHLHRGKHISDIQHCCFAMTATEQTDYCKRHSNLDQKLFNKSSMLRNIKQFQDGCIIFNFLQLMPDREKTKQHKATRA